jgi:hypothetical protein
MKILKLFFIAVSIIHLSSVVEARPAKSNVINMSSLDSAHVWVVSQGTRLVAGDPYQNEFYILDRKKSPKVASLGPKANSKMKTVDKLGIAKIRLALNKALDREVSRKNATKKIAVATRLEKHKTITNKKVERVALNTTHFEVGRAYVYR